MEYENHDNYKVVVMQTAEEVIHETCSLYNITQFQSERTRFQDEIRDSLDKRFVYLLMFLVQFFIMLATKMLVLCSV